MSVEVEDDCNTKDFEEEAKKTKEKESGDEGFFMAPHTIAEDEEEAKSQEQEGEEEEEQHGGLRALWKSMWMRFTPPKLSSSAHLVP